MQKEITKSIYFLINILNRLTIQMDIKLTVKRQLNNKNLITGIENF
jgi:hypothetical protein